MTIKLFGRRLFVEVFLHPNRYIKWLPAIRYGYVGKLNKASETELEFAPLNPTYVGSWCIGGRLFINVKERPTDEQIKNTEEMFGWEWKESE